MTYFEDVEIKFDKKTKKHVLIQRFADGTEAKTVLDARTKYFSVLKEELRKEHNEERKHRYWVTASLEGFEYEGEQDTVRSAIRTIAAIVFVFFIPFLQPLGVFSLTRIYRNSEVRYLKGDQSQRHCFECIRRTAQ